MVRDEQVGPDVEHLVDHASDRIDGEQHPAHGLVRVPAHQPDGIPALRERGVVTGVEGGDHIAQRHGHGSGL